MALKFHPSSLWESVSFQSEPRNRGWTEDSHGGTEFTEGHGRNQMTNHGWTRMNTSWQKHFWFFTEFRGQRIRRLLFGDCDCALEPGDPPLGCWTGKTGKDPHEH